MVNAFQIALGVVIVLASLVMIVTVLLQSSNQKGLGAVAGQLESYFSKNQAKTIDAKLALGTKIAATVFVVACLLFVLLSGAAA
ncbi:MAG: preprotein translocase subunit SecG [Clostridia bacterium]|nr:preprotein translocase subunit SecG [Clostridia bacterium]